MQGLKLVKIIQMLLLLVIACFTGAPVITTLLPNQTEAIVPAFYVAVNGNDSNAGTLALPFLTLGKCQTAMRGSGIKTCYIRAGNYTPTGVACGTNSCGVQMSSSDNGETWSYYPPDGYNNADISGGSTASGNGLWEIFDVSNTTNVTINGLSIHDFDFAGIAAGGGTFSLVIKNNIIFNGFFIVAAGPQNAGGFMCYGCANSTFSHNVVHDIASFGISNNNVNGDMSNWLVTGNVLYNICTQIQDCGAIYSQDTNATATNIQWTNNYIRDGSTFAGAGWGSALYADDCMSNVTASGNIITGKNGGNTTMIHGGNNVRYLANIIDLSTFAFKTFTVQTSSSSGCSAGTMSGNQLENNIVISGGGGGGNNLLSGSPVNAPTITGNAYHNYAGSAISTTGSYSDANPTSEDPQLTCWIYNVASGSPVFNSPVNFTAIVGKWGPPGYVIPQTGTAPSSPHTC